MTSCSRNCKDLAVCVNFSWYIVGLHPLSANLESRRHLKQQAYEISSVSTEVEGKVCKWLLFMHVSSSHSFTPAEWAHVRASHTKC